MHYERTNLPKDVLEVFFSDVYYYAASADRTTRGRPKFVGCGATQEEAFSDMRLEAVKAEQTATIKVQPATPHLEITGQMALLSDEQRQALAHNLVRLRASRKVAQLQVAQQALGFAKSHAAVSRLERAALRQVPLLHLDCLASFYATTVESLVQREPSPPGTVSPGSPLRCH